MDILESKLVRAFTKICTDGYEQDWHERNGGNLSYRLKEEEVEELKDSFDYDAE